jgi:hypothetical protein
VEHNNQFERKDLGTPMNCAEFDTLLSDALDGVLSATSQRRFDAHRQQCATCGPLFRDTSAGFNWLGTLEEVESPASLVHNILAATSMQSAAAQATAPKLGWKEKLSALGSDLLAPVRVMVRQPRLAMTAAMALFSVSLTLNLVGVKVSDIRHLDWRPSAIRQQATMKYYETSSRVVKYYENIRLVYEVESRLQELKRATSNTDEQEQPPQRNKTENKKDRERKQNYYSMGRQNMLLAKRSTTELNSSSTYSTSVEKGVSAEAMICRADALSRTELSRGLQPDNKLLRSLLA